MQVSIKRIVGNVARNLGLENPSEHLESFIEWAFEAEQKIGSFTTFIDTEKELTVTDGKALLPSDLVKLIDVKAGGFKLEPTQKTFKSEAIDRKYWVVGSYIHFANVTDGTASIAYSAVSVDADGYPTIKQGHEDAVAQYIMWRFKSVEYYNGKIARYIVQDLEKRWYWLCGQARGNDNLPSEAEMRNVAKYWNTLISERE
jgi:hypothetical protein|tara:strand:- start:1478 stop:2080 length:603 start_codon:yes stop_codon:yes gene_type:complete